MTAAAPARDLLKKGTAFRFVLYSVGQLGLAKDGAWCAPDIRAARALAVASGVHTTAFLATLLFTGWLDALPFIAGFALFLAALQRLSSREKLLAVTLYAGLWLAVLTNQALLLLLLGPGLLILSVNYLRAHRYGRYLDRQFETIEDALPGWKAFLPLNRDALHTGRVLVSPDKEVFFLGVAPGRKEVRYDQEFVAWTGTDADHLTRLADADLGIVKGTQKVLWVERPAAATGTYAPKLERGVTTLIDDQAALIRHLNDWSAMRRNLSGAGPAPTPGAGSEDGAAAFGREVEQEAITQLESVLLAGWRMDTNVILARGGDADIKLTSPDNVRFVIDVKARTDRFDPGAPKGTRAKSWAEIHAQVTQAARQLDGVGVVWQPRAPGEDFFLVDGVWSARGSAGAVMESLAALGQWGSRGRTRT